MIQIAATNTQTPGAVIKTISLPAPTAAASGLVVSANPASAFLYVNRVDGIITKIDLTTAPVAFTDVVTGGPAGGSYAAVGPDGCLYATQGGKVVRVSNADGTCLAAPLGPLVVEGPLVLSTPAQVIKLKINIANLNLPGKIAKSLTTRLDAALRALGVGDVVTACKSLQTFINGTRAQAGKGISGDVANTLIAEARRIKAVLGC